MAENQKYSRQRRWQLKQLALGLCRVCGRRRVNAMHCRIHAKQQNERARARKAIKKTIDGTLYV